MAIRTHIGAGARPYPGLVGPARARRPLVFSVAGSMPIGMYGLAILLLVRDANGSFAVAGRVVGAFGLANALGAVVQGRLMDRVGQSRVLRRAAAGHVAMLVALLGLGTAVGVLQVALPAYAAGRGSAAAGGFYLAAISAGSLCGGLVYGARSWPGAPSRRLPPLLLGIAP